MFALIHAPVPADDQPAKPGPNKKTLARQRQRALADIDPDGDVLPLEMIGSRYGQYREKLWRRDPHCIFCGRQMKLKDSTLDHALPRAQGGLNCPWNLWLSCSLCNHAKGDRSALQWLNDLLNACISMGLIDEDDAVHVEVNDPDLAEAAAFPAAFEASMEIGGVA